MRLHNTALQADDHPPSFVGRVLAAERQTRCTDLPQHRRRPLEHELVEAIDIQQRCYRLLRWLNSHPEPAPQPDVTGHGVMDEVEVAEQWIRESYSLLPSDARPPDPSDAQFVRRFANYFTSFLLVSFEVLDDPVMLESDCGCFCPICARLVPGPRLQSRRVGSRAKADAKNASARSILGIASSLDVEMTEADALSRVRDPEVRRASAVLAYAHDLIDRVNGRSADTMSLALWRRFAYDAHGKPIRGFEFSADIVSSSRELLRKLIGGS